MSEIELLFYKYSDELFAYLCRFTGNRGVAEDVLSTVFVRLIEETEKKGMDNMPNWRPWLYRVATNCAISHFRRQKIKNLFSLKNRGCLGPESISSHDTVEGKEITQRLKKIVEGLSEKLKSVIILNIYQELSYEEVAVTLKINIGTVKSRLNEAKRIIREKMEDLDGTRAEK